MIFCGIHATAISPNMIMNLTLNMCLEIALLKLPPHIPGANGLFQIQIQALLQTNINKITIGHKHSPSRRCKYQPPVCIYANNRKEVYNISFYHISAQKKHFFSKVEQRRRTFQLQNATNRLANFNPEDVLVAILWILTTKK